MSSRDPPVELPCTRVTDIVETTENKVINLHEKEKVKSNKTKPSRFYKMSTEAGSENWGVTVYSGDGVADE